MFNPLHSSTNQELFEKHLYNPRISKENNAARPNHINYRLKSEVSVTLRCRLCSTRYTAVRIKNCLKSTFAIKIVTMKNTDDFLVSRGQTAFSPYGAYRLEIISACSEKGSGTVSIGNSFLTPPTTVEGVNEFQQAFAHITAHKHSYSNSKSF